MAGTDEMTSVLVSPELLPKLLTREIRHLVLSANLQESSHVGYESYTTYLIGNQSFESWGLWPFLEGELVAAGSSSQPCPYLSESKAIKCRG
jgi:hypothetical protein